MISEECKYLVQLITFIAKRSEGLEIAAAGRAPGALRTSVTELGALVTALKQEGMLTKDEADEFELPLSNVERYALVEGDFGKAYTTAKDLSSTFRDILLNKYVDCELSARGIAWLSLS